ncbi:MAG TPA: hypothetical protein VJ249_08835 [Candidatus Bathyarchaeia archaeon]|nr:hypothetical protein [Candidatus Bathyarchaeia archaeon]
MGRNKLGIITVSKRELITSETETGPHTPSLTKPGPTSDEALTQTSGQAEPKSPYKNPNTPQETTRRLVDVT